MQSGLEAWGAHLIAEDGPQTPAASVARGFLAGCAGLYSTGLGLYLDAERLGLRHRTRLAVPVLSIGNLTVGGTGKTPMTQLLCRHLTEAGKRVVILSRGHGGEPAQFTLVSDAEGHLLSDAARAGDEPLLLARTLPGVPVLTGKDRRVSGREALRRFSPDVLVLDDGFQFWQLARDLDLVLLDARRPFDNGFPLPRGLLREPKQGLGRAQSVVVTRAECLPPAARGALRKQVVHLAPGADVFFACHRAAGFVPVEDLAAPLLPLNKLAGKRVIALSGIAQPQSFAHLLAQAGDVQIVHHLVFADHARYDKAEIDSAYESVRTWGAEALVMTEKDAVKWSVEGVPPLPCYALRITVEVEDESQLWASVQRHLFEQG